MHPNQSQTTHPAVVKLGHYLHRPLPAVVKNIDNAVKCPAMNHWSWLINVIWGLHSARHITNWLRDVERQVVVLTREFDIF